MYGARGQIALQPTDAPVSPATRKVYYNELVLNASNDATDEEAAIGVPDNTMDSLQGALQPGGGYNMAVNSSELVEVMLMGMKGGVTPTTPAGATNARLWTFPVGATLDMATIEWQTALNGVWFRGNGYMVNEFTISGNANGTNRLTATLFGAGITEMDGVGSNPAAPTGLADRAYPSPLQGFEATLAIDALGATPGTTQAPLFVVDWNFTFSRNMEREYAGSNTRNAAAVNMGMFKVSRAQITVRPARPEAMAEYKNWRNNTGRIIELTFGQNTVLDTGVAEVQSLVATGATSGSFTLSFAGTNNATVPIAFNATAAVVAGALTGLGNIGSNPPGVICAGGPLPGTPITITFAGPLAQGDQPALVPNNTSLVGGTAVITTPTPGTGFKSFVKVAIPGKWRAWDPSQSGSAARQWRFDLTSIRDTALATMARIQLQNLRTVAWNNT